MPLRDAGKLVSQLMQTEFHFFSESHEMGVSAWEELGNILVGAYARAISDWLNLSFHVSVPASAFDIVGALPEVALLESTTPGTIAVYIDTHLSSAGNDLTGHLLLLPEANAFQTVFERLGVDRNG
jgi:chemotaxis protein CheC